MSSSDSKRILTVPNGLSLLRLVGVPYFFWLIAVQESYGVAVIILALSGLTDWLDGFVARKFNQQSEFGAKLDPLVDRLYVVAALVALTITAVLPLWVLIVLVARDVYMSFLLWRLKERGYLGFPVHFVGKAATMNLLYALPLVLLGTFSGNVGRMSYIVGWAFLMWGIAMYWYGAILYRSQLGQVAMSGSINER